MLNEELDQVLGVQKSLGPWQNIGSEACSVVGTSQDWSDFPINNMLNLFNQNSNISNWVGNIDPQLYVADELYCPTESASGVYDPDDIEWAENCSEILEDNGFIDLDEDTDFDNYDALLAYALCNGHIYGQIAETVISSHNELEPGVLYHFHQADYQNADGSFILPEFTLDAGVYSIASYFSDGSKSILYLDNDERVVNNSQLCSFLDAIVFPVPIMGNSFNLQLHATAQLKFQYELVELNGNMVYSEKYEVENGHNKNHTISLNTIPSGILLHRFKFQDGSVKVIETSK